MLSIGKMRHRIRIQYNPNFSSDTPNRAANGALINEWLDHATVWSEIRPGYGREFERIKTVIPTVSHMIKLRWRRGLVPKMRIRYDDPREQATRYFGIDVVLPNPDPIYRDLTLVCTEIVGEIQNV